MTSQARIDANRKNAEKSTGPRTEAGKARAKMNGLKHGLRSEEIVLPTENRREFESHLQAWMDDWQPETETRRFLVERAATAAWRIKRCVKIEADQIQNRIRQAMADWDQSRADEVKEGVRQLEYNPVKAVKILMDFREGVEQLHAYWKGMAEALRMPEGWCEVSEHHNRLIYLMNIVDDDSDVEKGAVGTSSWSLLLRSRPELMQEDENALSDESEPIIRKTLFDLCMAKMDELEAEWKALPDDSVRRMKFAERKAFEAIDEDSTVQKYEARLDREAKSSIKLLMQLEKSGADLNEPEIEAPGTTEPNAVSPSPSEAKVETPETPPAPSEPNEIVAETPVQQADRDRGGRTWPVEGVAEVVEMVESDLLVS